MRHKQLVFFSTVVMLCMGLVTTAGGARTMPPGNVGDNIALNKSYTLSPAPNYANCTDADDATQLTNGQYSTVGTFWTQMSTVGWASPSSYPVITIDLGQVYPIRGISFNTAGGVADVYWPTAINLSVSNDGTNYYSAGELTGISNSEHGDAPSYGTYQVHRYYTNSGLAIHGRYVKIQVVESPYIFVDEIEIYRGANSLLGANMALNKSYTLNPAPNYYYCTDTGDATQLTDGQYTVGASLWTQLSTVGWNNSYIPADCYWASITIDLGQIQPIEGVSFNTAGGAACVMWPIGIIILVSDDNVNYYKAGELVTLSSEHGLPPASGYLVHSYWTDRLATYGRYVKILPTVTSLYTFVDEIEVYQGNSGMLTQPSRGSVITDMATYMEKALIIAGQARRIVQDVNNVQAQTDTQTGLTQTVRNQIKSLLTTSFNEAMFLPDPDPVTFKAILPLNISHARVFNALSKLWQAQGKTGLIVWNTSSQWDPLTITQAPPTTGNNPQIAVRMLQNEYRSAAFNLSNATDNALTVHLNINGLPGGTNPSYITVHEVAWTDTKEGIPITSALSVVENSNGFNINVPSGMTRQVWLTFHPILTNPGAYSGAITASSGGTVNIPISFNLSCLGLPAQPTLSLGGFDYTNRDSFCGMTTQNRTAFITHLREHFVDTTWGDSYAMPPIQNPTDFTAFDNWAARWPGVRNYRIYLACGQTFDGYNIGTPEFNTAVANWINAYVAHWTTPIAQGGMGLNLNQFALDTADEPRDETTASTVTQWANAIHAAQPDIKIWTDPIFDDPSVSYAQTMFQTIDILCPNRPFFLVANEAYRDAFREASTGKRLNFYSCEGGLLDPYSYYRLQAWTCLQENATAMHYWALGDRSRWNEYGFGYYPYYGPFFMDTSTMTAGKMMEAIREGVEDYEYLKKLKDRITYWQGQQNPPSLTAAIALRDSAADTVLNATNASLLNWVDIKDRTIADQKRIAILNILESLDTQTGGNIALNCPYAMTPEPNYWGCTDANDATQLTNGQYSTVGTFWTQMSTVGWASPSSNPTIIIDLGSIQPIKGVSYNTAGGVAGVYWPTAINMSFSSDGINYTSAGELASISNSEHGDAPSYGTYQVHRYWTDQLTTYGRYVKIEVAQSPYIFVDEIEVYKN